MGRAMSRSTRAAALMLIGAVAVAMPATAAAKKPSKPKVVGAFYTETNGNPNKLVVLTTNGKFVFAVNAGSNTVSSFKVTKHGVGLVNQVSSGGTFPNSLTVHGNVVYVLNSNSLSIQGLTFSSTGVLSAISGASQPLNPNGTIPGAPHDISFDNTGKWVVVAKLTNPMTLSPVDAIDTFHLNSNGTVGPAVSSNSSPRSRSTRAT